MVNISCSKPKGAMESASDRRAARQADADERRENEGV